MYRLPIGQWILHLSIATLSEKIVVENHQKINRKNSTHGSSNLVKNRVKYFNLLICIFLHQDFRILARRFQ